MTTGATDRLIHRILLVDDDAKLCQLLSEFLTSNGFELSIAHRGDEGLALAISDRFELILLDIMLPVMDGWTVLRNIRARSRIPVIMLTAQGEDVDRIVGLEIGADDYLPKPFNSRELVARIRAVLRRTEWMNNREGAGGAIGALVVGDVRMNFGARTVHVRGQSVEMTSLEFEVLRLLLMKAGDVVTRAALSKEILGRPLRPFDRGIDMHISNLRKKLGYRIHGCERIKTIRGIGYQYASADSATLGSKEARSFKDSE